MSDPLLAVDNLHVQFATEDGVLPAVRGLSFELEAGQTLGLVGESGSGKSVTAKAIMGLIPSPPGDVTAGTIHLEGRDLRRMSRADLRQLRGNEMSMIFQDPMTSLNPFLRISRQLTEVLQVHQGASEAQARTQAIEMLSLVGIPDAAGRIDQYPHQFSGGMRQRVMIAMALLCEPKLLIADEPTTALDVTIQAQILDCIKDLKARVGTSVILITHDLGVVAGMADRVLVMYAGQAAESAPARALFRQPAHPYSAGLLHSIPRLDQRGRRLQPVEGLPPDATRLPTGCPFHPRCGHATAACAEREPPRRPFGPAHHAFCHHPLRDMPATA
jgi:oligopeptide transport system ATP-binding protein